MLLLNCRQEGKLLRARVSHRLSDKLIWILGPQTQSPSCRQNRRLKEIEEPSGIIHERVPNL